ncbi:alpha/beta fold hydrolase [Nocardioides sp. LS1]|uniref:alpha/beta fold hydrolase n=1 Tax=Nocardioides sp. LS1 TaxID=1027620 RepID=UPI000F617BCD|nr:alpha/beta hydrolase [Nocardioides sp. LS1]GCD88168.1 alpha/beta hydrolase [Nocardioides sp. LS1]
MTTSTTAAAQTSATTPTQYLEAAGTTFAYRELGPRSGVPLVMLHHFTATIDDWDPRVLDGIAAERHVIYVDLRGVGGTKGRVPMKVDVMAQDAIAFIGALGLTEVDLLGFSLGGFIAQVVASSEPNLVRRLMLTGTGPAGFKGVGQFNRRLLTDSAQGAAKMTDPKPFLFFTRSKNGRAAAADYMVRISERSEDRVKRTSIRGAANQLIAISRWGAQPPMDLAAITQPTLVANGEDDRMLATRGSFELAHRIPNAQLVIYPDAGHGGVFQHHDRFVPEVLDFLR